MELATEFHGWDTTVSRDTDMLEHFIHLFLREVLQVSIPCLDSTQFLYQPKSPNLVFWNLLKVNPGTNITNLVLEVFMFDQILLVKGVRKKNLTDVFSIISSFRPPRNKSKDILNRHEKSHKPANLVCGNLFQKIGTFLGKATRNS